MWREPDGLTRTSEEVIIHGAHEALLILVWWDDGHFFPRVQALLGLVFQRFGESVTSYGTTNQQHPDDKVNGGYITYGIDETTDHLLIAVVYSEKKPMERE